MKVYQTQNQYYIENDNKKTFYLSYDCFIIFKYATLLPLFNETFGTNYVVREDIKQLAEKISKTHRCVCIQ